MERQWSLKEEENLVFSKESWAELTDQLAGLRGTLADQTRRPSTLSFWERSFIAFFIPGLVSLQALRCCLEKLAPCRTVNYSSEVTVNTPHLKGLLGYATHCQGTLALFCHLVFQ